MNLAYSVMEIYIQYNWMRPRRFSCYFQRGIIFNKGKLHDKLKTVFTRKNKIKETIK